MLRKLLIAVGLILITLNILVNAWIIYKGDYSKFDALIAWFTFAFFYVNMLDDIND